MTDLSDKQASKEKTKSPKRGGGGGGGVLLEGGLLTRREKACHDRLPQRNKVPVLFIQFLFVERGGGSPFSLAYAPSRSVRLKSPGIVHAKFHNNNIWMISHLLPNAKVGRHSPPTCPTMK